MGLTTKFAPQYERDKNNLIHFPSDTSRRKAMFVQESFEHPAKANISMVEELIKFTSKEGDLILDPFGGTGTLMIGDEMGRRVVLMELNPRYCTIIRWNI